jgi:hypothetical protein
MPSWVIQPIPLENLQVDLYNPRYEHRTSQRETLTTIAHDQGIKLVNLAEDIADKGLNPSELTIVAPTDNPDIFTVLEGNRRVAALKILSSPSLLNSLGLSNGLTKRYKALHDITKDALPTDLNCVVMTRDEANYWIQLKHTGENEGVGVVNWDGRAKQRFRGSSPALQAIELVEHSGYLDDDTKKKLPKIAITNIERLLNTPDARKILGVDIQKGGLVLTSQDEESLARLAMVVSDVANRQVKVTQLDTKTQRVDYAKQVAARPLPTLSGGAAGTAGAASGSSTGKASKQGRQIKPDRKTLIPKQFKIAISHTRINRIYHELQKLQVEQFVNSCAAMFRVFVELSVDEFAKKKKISLKITPKPKAGSSKILKPKDMTLREKIRAAADFLEKNGHSTKGELFGIRALANNREHFLSVNSLNAYLHNPDYSPTQADLKSSWDNVQIFIEHIWTV